MGIERKLRESLHDSASALGEPSLRLDDLDLKPVAPVRSPFRVSVAVLVALSIAIGIFLILGKAFSTGGTQGAGQGIGSSFTDHGVPVTYEEIIGTLHRRDDSTITQGSGEPGISQREAVAFAWHPQKNGELPGKIVTAFVDWNGTPTWVVSLQGGNICSPYTGPVSQPPGAPVCVNFFTYRIDAATGQVVDRFTDGHLVPASQTASAPVPSLVDILEGNGGSSRSPATGSPLPAGSGAPVFRSGPGSVPAPLLNAAVDSLNSHNCSRGSLDTVAAEGSIQFANLRQLEPHAAFNIYWATRPNAPRHSTPIYAVAVTGRCELRHSGRWFVEGYVEFLGDGTILDGQAWPATSAPSITEPFSASLDRLGFL
jgi:hypothetical protein